MENNKTHEGLPQKEALVLRFSAKSVASFRHPHRNEDTVGFDEKTGWAVVLDGVGGSEHGDLASQKGLEVIGPKLAMIEPDATIDEAKKLVKEAIEEASRTIRNDIYEGETTVVTAKILGAGGKRKVIIGSVGDSRAYLVRSNELQQITEDDSVIPNGIREKLDLVETDVDVNDEERSWFDQRNLITQDLGDWTIPTVHLFEIELAKEDKLLLTSDGVHDNLTINEIQRILVDGGDANVLVESAERRSRDSAHFRAKPDDISAVAVEVN